MKNKLLFLFLLLMYFSNGGLLAASLNAPGKTGGPLPSAQELFEDETDGAVKFINDSKTFDLIGKFHITKYTGQGYQNSDKFIDNFNNCMTAPGVIGSIRNHTSGYINVQSLWLFSSADCNFVSNNGSAVIRGKKSGVTQYTISLSSSELNNLQVTDNGFTFINFSTYSASTVPVDELEFEVGGMLRYLAIDNISYNYVELTQSTSVTASGTTGTTTGLSWAAGTGTSRAVFMSAASIGTPTVTDGTTYSANTAFGLGTSAGTGWYCVYNGTGSSVNVTGLTAGVTYRTMVVEYNGSGSTARYSTITTTGNPNNVTTTSAVSITAAITAQTNIACNGSASGSATVTAGGGLAPYTYSWSPSGGTAATASGLMAGVYTVTVTDANGAIKTAQTTITQPTAFTVTTSQTNVSMNGASNGSAGVTVSGGNSPYTYSWSPSGGTAAIATGLAAGNYTVTITDAYLCSTTRNFSITQPAPITAAITAQTNVACNGGASGSATVTAGGGLAPYTYSWSPSGGTAATASGLVAGVYTVTVTDANGAIKTAQATITQPTAFTVTTSQTNVSMNGASNGSAGVTVSGGNSPYTYSWSPSGGTAAIATGLAAGNYTVTITDAYLCSTTRNFSITQPAPITAAITAQTNVACNGGASGSATVTAGGGLAPYTYSWSPSGGTAATASGLVAGVYTVTVTDANGAIKTAQATITQPTAFTVTTSQTNVSMNGASNGSAGVTVSGGNSPYTYSWSPSGGTAATATGLAAGNYTVTITDAYLCSTTRNFSITQPAAITAAITAQTNVACNGGASGSATVTAGGGLAPYTYSWSPSGGTAATASGLVAGVYTVTVTDANGAIKTAQATITQPTAFTVTTSQTNVSMNGASNGSAGVTVSGGNSPYTYSWSPSGGTAAMATGLTVGNYTVTITDAYLCSTTRNFSITQPAAITAAITAQTNIACNGGATGSATVTAGGGLAPYTYSWSPSGGTAATASGLVAGVYTVTVTDANGAIKTAQTTITQPTAFTVTTSQTNVSMNGASNGSAGVTVSGGNSPYTYSWSPSGGTAATATGLAAGNYTVTITDAYLCSTTRNFSITQPAAITAAITAQTNIACNGSASGSATVTAGGGLAPYTYSWSPSGGTAATASGLVAGVYTVTVTDANGAIKTAQTTITQPMAITAITSQNNVSITGGNDGVASVSVSGGTTPYNYSWSPSGGTAATASGLTAGTYVCTITDGNGCTTTKSVTLLQPAALTGFTIGQQHYGDAQFTLTAPTSSSTGAFSYTSSNKLVATVNGNTVTVLKPGTTTITAEQAAAGSYASGSATATLTVSPKDITVTITTTPAITKVYDGTTSSTLAAANYQLNGLEGSDDVSISGDAAYDTKEAGTDKTITVTGLALAGEQKDYYHLSALSSTATGAITAQPVTVTVTAASKTYGDSDPEFLYTFTPALIGGDNFSGSLQRITGEAVGAYKIGQGTLALSSNYALMYKAANLVIGKRAVTVTADAQTKTYGEADPALTYQAIPALIGGDAFTGSLTRATGETAGAYKISQGTLVLSDNYNLAYQGAKLTIGQKAITVTADAQTKTYGDADPALTYTFTPALISGDDFSGSLARQEGEAVGSYTIGQGTLALSDNYNLSYDAANLAIGQKAIAVTADAQTKTYGEADPALTYTFTPALPTGAAFTGSLTRAQGEEAGVHAITQGTLALDENYTLTYSGADLVIGQKAITVTADAQAKTYGDTDPALTYMFSPALIGEDAFTGALSRATGEAAGDHAITQGTLALNSNYTLSYQGANLVIGKKDIAITAIANTKVYGQPDPTLVYTFTPALISGDAFTGTLGRASGKNVGSYAIGIGTLTAGDNYNVTTFTPADLTISPAALTITAEDKTRGQGKPNPAFTFKYDGLAGGDAPSDLTTAAQAQTMAITASPIGYYDITASGATSGNYTITFVKGKLSVVPSEDNHVKAWSNNNVLEVRIYADVAQQSVITLYTVSGQPLVSVQKQLQPGINSTTISIGSIARGVYVLGVKADRFKEGQRVKIK